MGDRCTSYFHGIAKRNAKRNFIASVFRPNGTRTTGQPEGAKEFVEYYQNLLGVTRLSTQLNGEIARAGPLFLPEHVHVLDRDVTPVEIKEAP
jgi:hypothetical protein